MTHPSDPHRHAPDPHAEDGTTGPHGSPADHGADHGHDDHAHAPEALRPVNLVAWAAGALGVVLGLVVFLALGIAAGTIG